MRVLVMRDHDDAADTAARLARLGHAAVLAPVIEITPLPTPVPPGPYDAVLATSRHAFTPDPGLRSLPRRLPVFAVGRRTAAAARAAGFDDVRIGTGDGADLATLVTLTLRRPAQVLYLAGRDRKPALEPLLVGAGLGLVSLETYAADPVARWPETVVEALREGQVDAALHFSRRSAELALVLTERLGVGEAFLRLRHACLSADVAAPVLAGPAPWVAVAETPDQDSLLALLSQPSWAGSIDRR